MPLEGKTQWKSLKSKELLGTMEKVVISVLGFEGLLISGTQFCPDFFLEVFRTSYLGQVIHRACISKHQGSFNFVLIDVDQGNFCLFSCFWF